jgi:hypothetical protein
MTVLLTWHDHIPHDTPLIRQYLDFVAFVWWDMHFIQTGNPMIVQEHPFGGNRLLIRWRDWWWDANSGTGLIDDILEDFYMLPPPYTTPISPGVVGFNTFYDIRIHANVLVLAPEPNDTHVAFNRLPPVPPTYWYQPGPQRIPDNLIDTGVETYPPPIVF